MQKEASWDSRRKSVGEISDQHVRPQDEKKTVQKRTFTRWMNVFLQRCDPPLEVRDLFTDIQDGRILMALLEKLSGCKLLYRFRSPSHHIFRLNNISKALAFLDDRHVKLLGIDASSIADGTPAAVLNLVWNIILYFQVMGGTGGLQRRLSSSLSSLSMSSYPSSSDLSPQTNDTGNYTCYTLPSKGKKAARESKYHGKAIKTLLQWVQRCTSKYGVEVHDFGKSWRSGLAFLAVIKSMNPGLVDLRQSLSREPRDNVEQALMIAHQSLDIPPLLEPEDVTCTSPDEQSIITYVSMFLGQCPDVNEDYTTATFAVCEFPHFGSLDSLATAYDPRAQASLSEQPGCKHWSRTSSGSTTSFQMNGSYTSDLYSSYDDVFSPCYSITAGRSPSFSPFNQKKGTIRSDLQPPSLLDRGIASQDSPLWMDQRCSRQKADEFSLSSEEGTDSLSALDSDEEDAYTYILDLNKEIFLPHNLLKRQVARVEEETAEELSESEHPDVCKMLNGNGWKLQGDIDVDSGVKAPSVVHGKFAVDKKESNFRDLTDSRDVFDTEPDDEGNGKEPPEDGNVVRVQGNGNYSEKEKTGHAGVVTYGHDETAARVDEAEKTKMLKMSSWQKEAEEDSKKWLVNEKIVGDDKEEMELTYDEGENIKLDPKEEKNNETDEDEENVQIDTFEKEVNGGEDESVYEVRFTSTARAKVQEDGEDSSKNSRNNNTETKNSETGLTVEKTDRELKSRKCKFTVKMATTINCPGYITSKNDAGAGSGIHDGNSDWTSACKTAVRSPSSEGGLLQSLAAVCGITPLELEMLLALWILLYCCLILSQMNL